MSLCVLQWHEFEYMLYYHMIICPDYLYGCFSCQPNDKSAFWDSTTSSHSTWMFQILVGMSGKQENNLVLWSTILISYYCHIKWVCTSNNDDPLQCLPIYQHQQLFGNVHKPLLTIFHELGKIWFRVLHVVQPIWGHRLSTAGWAMQQIASSIWNTTI